ncbi:hypothetical protein ACIL2K_002629 [Vibrio vulnificus]|nr:hypothetical protein [Vibrio parahaemolyticus]
MKNDNLDECFALVTSNQFINLCHHLNKTWGKGIRFKSVKKIVAHAFGYSSETHLIQRLKVRPIFKMDLVNCINNTYFDFCRFHYKEIIHLCTSDDIELSEISIARDLINSSTDVGEFICFQLAIRSLPMDTQYSSTPHVGINSLKQIDDTVLYPSLYRSVAEASKIPSMSVSEVSSTSLINRNKLNVEGLINVNRSVLYYDEANRYLPESNIEDLLGNDGTTIDDLMYTTGFASLVIKNTKQNLSALRDKMLGNLYALSPTASLLRESIVVEVIEISAEANQSKYFLSPLNDGINSKATVAIPDYFYCYGAELLRRSGLIISTLIAHNGTYTTCFGDSENTHNQVSLICSSPRYINDDTPIQVNVMNREMLSLELVDYGASETQLNHMHKSVLALRAYFICTIFTLQEESELKSDQSMILTRANRIGAKNIPLVSDSLSVLILIDRKGICDGLSDNLINTEDNTLHLDTDKDVDFWRIEFLFFTRRLQRAGVVKINYTYVQGALGNETNCCIGLDSNDNDVIVFELLQNESSPDYPIFDFYELFFESLIKVGIQVFAYSYESSRFLIDTIPSKTEYYPFLVGEGCKISD